MATAPPLLSIEEYLHTCFKPDVHYVDGEVEERNVGERTHNFIQQWLVALFARNEEAWAADAIIEQRIRMASNRVRVCDVAIVRATDPWEEVITTPPLACIEVMSPDDRLSRAEEVLADYFAMGVPNVWLIDPYKRKSHQYGPDGMRVSDASTIAFPGTEIVINLNDLFATLDRKRAARRL